MVEDVVRGHPALFLGTRLKRLGERLQGDVLKLIERTGLPLQPSHYPLLYALERQGLMSVGDLVLATGVSQPGVTRSLSRLEHLGVIATRAVSPDRRRKLVSLTDLGHQMLAISKREVWPHVERAVLALCAELEGPLLTQLEALEVGLDRQPLHLRAGAAAGSDLSIEPFTDALATTFHDINADWIETMFVMEATDREVLEDPRRHILQPGGDILFVRAADVGIVGAGALKKTGDREFELTKMGVLESARGRKAGEFLLDAIIGRAGELGAETLYLLTNRKCAAAIHLYEKVGFVHDAGIMARFGARYSRCDVAMRFHGPLPTAGRSI